MSAGEVTNVKVLLASDGSENALRAAQFVGRLVRDTKDAEVTIVYVMPPSAIRDGEGHPGPFTPDVPLDAMIRHAAEPIWTATQEAMGPVDARVDVQFAVGDPADEIVRLADWDHYDLIVVGRRGLGSLKEIVLGSVSHRLVHTAHCPVLVAR